MCVCVSWVKKFGEHNGLDILLHILKSCCGGSIQGKDAILRRIQHQCVRCLRAFMNNTVSVFVHVCVFCG